MSKYKRLLGNEVTVTVDRPIGFIEGTTEYPINCGRIAGLRGYGEDVPRAYILGVSSPVSTFIGIVTAILDSGPNSNEALVVSPKGQVLNQCEIAEKMRFLGRFTASSIIPLYHKSCGIVPIRLTNNGIEFLIILQARSKKWSFPKGHTEAFESELQTAVRELKEETGLSANVYESINGTLNYRVGTVMKKKVKLFLGIVTGEPSLTSKEVLTYRWVSEADLSKFLFPAEVNICRKLYREYKL